MRTYIHKPETPAHGVEMQCPNCNAHGHYDDMHKGLAEFKDSVWYSSGRWWCVACCSRED